RRDRDDVAVAEHRFAARDVVDLDAVLAMQIAHEHAGRRFEKLRVMPGQRGIAGADLAPRVAADAHGADEQHLALAVAVLHDEFSAYAYGHVDSNLQRTSANVQRGP